MNLAIEKHVKNSTKISRYDRGGLDTRVASANSQDKIAHPTMVAITGTATSTKKQNFRPNDKRNAYKNYFKLLCSLKIRTLSKTRTSGNLRITNMESLRRWCSFKLDNGIPQKEFAIPLKEVLIYNL